MFDTSKQVLLTHSRQQATQPQIAAPPTWSYTMELKELAAIMLEPLVKHLSRVANSMESIEAHYKSGTSAPAAKVEPKKTETKTESKKTTSAAKPTHTRDEVNAALIKLKDDCGKEIAAAVIKDVGGVVKMADIPEAKFDEVFAAAEKEHAERVGTSDEPEDL
jgi:hypothetical protein